MPLSRQRRIVHATSGIELVTIPNVELLEVGMDWETSTGVFTFTEDDLLSAANAMSDPAVRTPVAKLGHTDPRYDGDFSIGRFDNLRVNNNGQTLLSDWVGVPRWFAEIVPAAYPRRSIEGRWDWESYTGNRWPFYLTAVALLGERYPAIATIEDIRAFWAGEPVQWEEVAASEDPPYAVRCERGIVMRADQVEASGEPNEMKWRKQNVDASVEVSDIVRAFYDSLDANQSWWWIRSVQVDPPQLIVDDDDGHLYRVGYTVKNDEVEFADPVAVKVQYEDVADKKAAASWASDSTAVTYPTRTASRGAIVSPRAAQDTPSEDSMNEAQKALIGLPADATDEQVTARLTELAASATPEPEPTTPPAAPDPATPAPADEPKTDESTDVQIPDGMALVDAATLEQLKKGYAEVSAKMKTDESDRRKAIVDAAIKDGKFPRSRREHYDGLMASDDPKVVEHTEKLIASMSAGVIPVDAEHGTGSGDLGEDGQTAEAYPASWLPEVAAAKANGSGRPTIQTEA